jgi:hypothetical protein
MLKVITFCWDAEQCDKPIMTAYCQWLLCQHISDVTLVTRLLATEEAGFMRDGIFYFHNSHLWAENNPHARHFANHQCHFSINVWAGIIRDDLLGPLRIQGRLTGASYLHLLQDELCLLLENNDLQRCQQMWLLHDGAPPHFSAVWAFLNTNLLEWKTERGGPQTWPPRSPDLYPKDFFLWGHVLRE